MSKNSEKKIYILVMIFFLLYIPYWYFDNFSSDKNYYSKNSYFRSNIYSFRKIVEKFYDINKKYPQNIDDLKINALSNKYWKQPRDTFKSYDYDLIDLKKIPLSNKEIYSEKLSNDSIGYKLIQEGYNTKYIIYGINKDGSFLDNGLLDKKIFYLEGDLINSKGEFINQ